jgi:CBS domain-containing protein
MARAPDTVGEVMIRDVATVGPDEPMEVALRRMNERDIGSVVVVEGDRPVGIVTERDVVRHALDPGELRTRRVGDLMSAPLVTIGPEAEVVEAFDLMTREGIRRLPVVQDGRLVGIVAERDLLRWVSQVARE